MTGAPRLVVLASLDEIASSAADRFVRLAADSIAARGRFSVALSGGETPRALFRVLAAPRAGGGRRDDVAWDRVHVWWGDERHVPPDDEQSNYRMAREALLDHVGVPDDQVHRMRGELPADEAADSYESELRAASGVDGGGTARDRDTTSDPERRLFDLTLLGLGTDAHTASLFPGSDALEERRRWVAAPWVQSMRSWRITLTPPALLAAGAVLVLVSGEGKSTALARVLEGDEVPAAVPARILHAAGDRVEWMVDRAAASKLDRSR